MEVFESYVAALSGTWFHPGLGGAGLMLGLDDPRSLFQPKVCYSVIFVSSVS